MYIKRRAVTPAGKPKPRCGLSTRVRKAAAAFASHIHQQQIAGSLPSGSISPISTTADLTT